MVEDQKGQKNIQEWAFLQIYLKDVASKVVQKLFNDHVIYTPYVNYMGAHSLKTASLLDHICLS